MPRRLGLPDEARFEGKGLSYRLPPIDEITAHHVVVVGGGDSALDTALSLRTIAEVTIVHRREAFSAYAFSQKRLAEADIKLVTNGEIVELLGNDHLERVVVARTDGSTVECPADLLMVSIGQAPELQRHRALGARPGRLAPVGQRGHGGRHAGALRRRRLRRVPRQGQDDHDGRGRGFDRRGVGRALPDEHQLDRARPRRDGVPRSHARRGRYRSHPRTAEMDRFPETKGAAAAGDKSPAAAALYSPRREAPGVGSQGRTCSPREPEVLRSLEGARVGVGPHLASPASPDGEGGGADLRLAVEERLRTPGVPGPVPGRPAVLVEAVVRAVLGVHAAARLERHEPAQAEGADAVVVGRVAHERHPVAVRRRLPHVELVAQRREQLLQDAHVLRFAAQLRGRRDGSGSG